MAECADLALQAIAGRTGLVAEQQLTVPARQLVDQTPDRLGRVVDLTESGLRLGDRLRPGRLRSSA
jgi:hypothetical protein